MKNGLILSGGGARGFAHLGVMQALDELGVKIDAIAGASAGSVAGAFYLAGHKPADILKHITSYKFYEWARFRWKTPGILHMDKIAKLFEKYLPDSFEKLPKPLVVSTTDLVNCRSVYFSAGKLIPPICASASIPVMFEPVIINGIQHIDGGVLDNFPVETLREKCDNIIGIHVNPVPPGITEMGIRQIMDRSLHLSLNRQIAAKQSDCDFFIEPAACSKFGLLDLSKAEEIMKVGYDAAMERRDELVKLK